MCSKKSCSTIYCYNTGKLNPNLAFHRFPSNEELCKKWVEWCGSSEIMDVFKSKGSRFINKNRVICSDHFKSSDCIIWKGVGNKTLLFKDSILSVLTALPKVLSPHVIQCLTNSQSQGTSKIQEKSNTLCHRRLFIDPEPELESPNIITVKPLPKASENNIKKRKCVLFFNELYNFTAVLYYTFIACVCMFCIRTINICSICKLKFIKKCINVLINSYIKNCNNNMAHYKIKTANKKLKKITHL